MAMYYVMSTQFRGRQSSSKELSGHETLEEAEAAAIRLRQQTGNGKFWVAKQERTESDIDRLAAQATLRRE